MKPGGRRKKTPSQSGYKYEQPGVYKIKIRLKYSQKLSNFNALSMKIFIHKDRKISLQMPVSSAYSGIHIVDK
ncbi:hypothetical protein AAEY27_17220 [Kosakonia sp. BYX6]|uniref:Uncharacterized protein n=1 Tax=Kosakonia calanthes TaxID=3139408 RepID=A0ABZ3B247_9ENTR